MIAAPCIILVVEDDPNDALLVQRAIKQCTPPGKVEVAVVNSVDAGVAYLQRDPLIFCPPVLILQDIKMPLKSGFELLGWIRQQPNLKRVPVIMLTASAAERDIAEAYDLGANSYLVKPVKYEALCELVSALDQYWLRHNTWPHTGPSRA